LVGLTSLNSKTWPMPPQLNEKRAQFVLTKIDQILEWERETERERDTRFVELGRLSLRGAGGTVLAPGKTCII
jgi:hypothetical protein